MAEEQVWVRYLVCLPVPAHLPAVIMVELVVWWKFFIQSLRGIHTAVHDPPWIFTPGNSQQAGLEKLRFHCVCAGRRMPDPDISIPLLPDSLGKHDK